MGDEEKKAYLAAKKRKWRADNRERYLAVRSAYYAKNKEKILDAQKARPNYLEDARRARAKYRLEHPELVKEQKKQSYRKNVEKIKDKNKEYYARNIEALKAKSAVYRKANRENILEKMKAYSEANAEREARRAREWRKAHPEMSSHYYGVRKARKLENGIGPIDWKKLIEESKMICGICDEPIMGAYQFDHIIPLKAGGPHTQENLQLAHPRCNASKKAQVGFKITKKDPVGSLVG